MNVGARSRRASDRLAPPSDSGRLPLPKEVGVAPVGGGRLEVFTDETFTEQVLERPGLVLVDFWAESCVPCHLQEPNLRRLAREFPDRLTVGRLNAFDCPNVPERYGIKGIPHLLGLLDGEVVLELVGGHTYDQLRHHLRPWLED